MIGLYVTVPIACFRRGLAREYLETERLPPPSTCYGFLLSLVGETRRARHVGCRVAPGLVGQPSQSVVLRTVWRCKDSNTWTGPNGQTHLVSSKDKKTFVKWALEQGWPEPHFGIGLGRGTNARPDYQQLLTGVEALIWCDSVDELRENGATLEERVATAMQTPHRVCRFGGLSLGESTHLVDEVCLIDDRTRARLQQGKVRSFLLHPTGRMTLPVWVDHVGSAGTRYVTGDLVECDLAPPPIERMPQVRPPD
jgi:CRISPR-associated protein Cas5t